MRHYCNCAQFINELGETPDFLVVKNGKRTPVCLNAKPTRAQKEQFLRTANGASCRVVALQPGEDPRPARLRSLSEIREAFDSGDQNLVLLELEDGVFRVVSAWVKERLHIDKSVAALSSDEFRIELVAPLRKVSDLPRDLPSPAGARELAASQ